MKGFTLIELLIVLAIIVTLVSVVFPAIFGTEKKEFIEFCIFKGGAEEDGKWEYKRLKNGESSKYVYMDSVIMK